MIPYLFAPTRTTQSENRTQRAVYWLLCLLIAAAIVLAASGSGNPATADPLPDWLNTGANLLCLVIAVFVLLARTRVWGAMAAGVNMVPRSSPISLSMAPPMPCRFCPSIW